MSGRAMIDDEAAIAEMQAEVFEPHGPPEFARVRGCYYSVNRGPWARSWWARDYVLGPIGILPK